MPHIVRAQVVVGVLEVGTGATLHAFTTARFSLHALRPPSYTRLYMMNWDLAFYPGLLE